MKNIDRIIGWSGLLAAIGLAYALSLGSAQADDTKPFKETGTETILLYVGPDVLLHPFLTQVRAERGRSEDLGVVIEQLSKNNVGGKGTSLAYELVFWGSDIPGGQIAYVVKFETVASGDHLVFVGVVDTFNPDGTAAGTWQLVPEEGTGRFAGAEGAGIVTGGYGQFALSGWITTVGAAKN